MAIAQSNFCVKILKNLLDKKCRLFVVDHCVVRHSDGLERMGFGGRPDHRLRLHLQRPLILRPEDAQQEGRGGEGEASERKSFGV